MGKRQKTRATIIPERAAIFALCLLWAFIFVKIPDFTIGGISGNYSIWERDYLFELRKKYSGTQRVLTIKEAREAIAEACAFIEKSKNSPGIYNTEDAKELLFGTACTESALRPRFQDVGGDAIGLFQIEYATFRDLWDRGIPANHPDLYSSLQKTYSKKPTGEITFEQLQQSDVVCAVFARMKYAQTKASIPSLKNEKAQANYYKKYYNTHLGKATPKDFIKRKHHILGNNE